AEEPHESGPGNEAGDASPHQLGIATRPTPEPHWRQDRTSHDRASVEPALQVNGEIAGRLVARFWITLEATCADSFQIAVVGVDECAQFRCRCFGGLP